MAYKFQQGCFRPKNPKKYRGNINNIYYRSSWELKVMQFFDRTDQIIAWNSEEVVISYISPVDGRPHRYFVDFVFQKLEKDGSKSIHLLEVKPEAQAKTPIKGKKKNQTYLNEVLTFEVNKAKWEAARAHCAKRGWTFHIATEKNLKAMGLLT